MNLKQFTLLFGLILSLNSFSQSKESAVGTQELVTKNKNLKTLAENVISAHDAYVKRTTEDRKTSQTAKEDLNKAINTYVVKLEELSAQSTEEDKANFDSEIAKAKGLLIQEANNSRK